jgi:hypothetical protein
VYEQLGDAALVSTVHGTTTDRWAAVSASSTSDGAAISAGFINTCVLLSSGTVQCWGRVGGEIGPASRGENTSGAVSNAQPLQSSLVFCLAMTLQRGALQRIV